MELLADSALADREGVPQLRRPSPVGKHPLASVGIAAVRLPGGGCTNLMRVMQTNACSLSCGYCPTFCGGNVPRVSISPDETARTFMDRKSTRLNSSHGYISYAVFCLKKKKQKKKIRRNMQQHCI